MPERLLVVERVETPPKLMRMYKALGERAGGGIDSEGAKRPKHLNMGTLHGLGGTNGTIGTVRTDTSLSL